LVLLSALWFWVVCVGGWFLRPAVWVRFGPRLGGVWSFGGPVSEGFSR
jgi:hypothetical protein